MTLAVVLAAGMGTRLMPLTADRPKALVEVAGESLLSRLIASCASAGISEAIVITGYMREAIDALADGDAFAVPTRTVFNDKFDTLGNCWSLHCAKDAVGGRDFIKLDGDVVVDSAIVRALVDAAAASAIVLDDHAALDDEAMKARLDPDGHVSALGKWLSIDESAGESIGIEKIAAADAPRVFDAIRALVDEGRGDAYYEDAYHALVQQGWHLGAVSTAGRHWSEVDDALDLERARAMVQP